MSRRRGGERAVGARPYRELPDPELIAGMRRDDAKAMDEFILRFEPLLREHGLRGGLPSSRASEIVFEVLGDVGGLIVAGKVRPSGSLAGYLLKAFRNRCRSEARRARDRPDDDSARASDALAPEDAAHSEDSIRASHGLQWEQPAASPILTWLAERLARELDESEWLMLSWLGHHVPQREIAEWLGVSYAAATQRLWRLRDRLRRVAVDAAAELGEEERTELMRFFRRVRSEREVGGPTGRRSARGSRSGAGDVAGRAREDGTDD